jgi:drug/metabolite transporter (DMT)-like permease
VRGRDFFPKSSSPATPFPGTTNRPGSMNQQRSASLHALAAVLLWSTVASAFKLSLRHLDPIQLVFFSTLASTLVLGGILALQGRLFAAFRRTRREYLLSLGFGLLNPLLYYLILFKAYDLLPAQQAQPINYTWAITLALLSIPLLGQRISRGEILAVLVSYLGVVVIATHGAPWSLRFADPLGVGLALSSTVIWALYWIFNTRDTRPPVEGLFLNFLLALPCALLVCVLFSTPLVADWRGLAGAAYVGAFEMGVTFVLWLGALKRSSNTAKVGNLIFLSPFLSLVFIHFLVGEDIAGSTFAGLGLIMGSLAIQRFSRSGA